MNISDNSFIKPINKILY